MQVAAARACGARHIVTRNVKDYHRSPIPAIRPQDALGELSKGACILIPCPCCSIPKRIRDHVAARTANSRQRQLLETTGFNRGAHKGPTPAAPRETALTPRAVIAASVKGKQCPVAVWLVLAPLALVAVAIGPVGNPVSVQLAVAVLTLVDIHATAVTPNDSPLPRHLAVHTGTRPGDRLTGLHRIGVAQLAGLVLGDDPVRPEWLGGRRIGSGLPIGLGGLEGRVVLREIALRLPPVCVVQGPGVRADACAGVGTGLEQRLDDGGILIVRSGKVQRRELLVASGIGVGTGLQATFDVSDRSALEELLDDFTMARCRNVAPSRSRRRKRKTPEAMAVRRRHRGLPSTSPSSTAHCNPVAMSFAVDVWAFPHTCGT